LLPRFDTLQRRLDLLQAFPTPEILQDDSKFERLIPGMVSAIRSLKDQNKSQLPIIAVTADVLLETQEQAHAAGFNDFLHKPVQRANLTRLLSQYQQLSG